MCICDTIPQKTRNPLFRLSHLDSLRPDHKGYFTRKGPAVRHVVQAYNFQSKEIVPPGRGDWIGPAANIFYWKTCGS